MLAPYRTSGDEVWLKEARNIALRALRPRLLKTPFARSRHRGAVASLVLAEELRMPIAAVMPLFESEG